MGEPRAGAPGLPPAAPPHRRPALVGLVAVGGAAGSVARYATALALPEPAVGWPWATFAVNVLGAFALGLLVEVLVRRGEPTAAALAWRAGLGTGFLGGFTTVSAFALQTERLVAAGGAVLAGGYVAGTVTGGVLAALAGTACAATVGARRVRA